MVKKLFLMVMVLVALTATCYAEIGNTPLSQKISRVLNSVEYCISFKFDVGWIDNESNKDVPYFALETFAKKGNDKVILTKTSDSDKSLNSISLDLLHDGYVYSSGIYFLDKVNMYWENPADVKKYIREFDRIPSDKYGFNQTFDSDRFSVHSYFPAFVHVKTFVTREYMTDGTAQLKRMPYGNYTEYSKSGKQQIEGKTYKFEEYVSPKDAKKQQLCRYYFLDGNLRRVVEITNPVAGEVEKIMEDAMKAEPVLAKNTEILEIDKFTDKADAELFTVPENYRVISDDELNRFGDNTVQYIN